MPGTQGKAGFGRRARLPALIALALAALLAPAAAEAKEATVTSADVRMRLAPDASLLVDELLTVEYDGSFEATYRDINLKHGERITDVAVSEPRRGRYAPGGCVAFGCFDRDGTFGATRFGKGVRIVWHHGAADETRRFHVTYRLDGAVTAYDDVLDVAWQVWGDEWDQGLDELRASFSDPALRADDGRYRVWGYPRGVEGETVRGDRVATLEATDVPPHEFVAMRVLVPRTPDQGVGGARVVAGGGLEKILAEEEAKDDDYRYSWARLERFLGTNTALIGGLTSAISLGILLLLAFLARERRTATPRYLSGPPEPETSPALAYALAKEGGDSTDTVLATLLDLVDRGHYTASPATTDGEKQDLAITRSATRPGEDELEQHERVVLRFFDELIDGDTVPLSEMKDRVPQHSESWRSKWQAMTSALNGVEEGILDWDRNYAKWKWIVLVLASAVFALLTIAYVRIQDDLILPLAIAIPTEIAILFFPTSRLRRLSAESRERNARWGAFGRWTRDFPRLEDDPPATLDLWRRILVYGVAFGTAERMIQSGRIPEPVVAQASSDGYWTNYALTGALVSDSLDGGSFGSSFSSHVAPESSSSGGGGGFSGGGGGFSGGGGGGSW